MAIRFAPDGRVFVAEKDGLIKVFDNLNDPTPTVYADLRTKVHDFWDRGLLGMALDPQFTTGRPYVYVLYTHDAAIGGTAPRWGDDCPTPPGPDADGCVVSGRLSQADRGRHRAGADRGLVPAVPEPLDRHARVRPRRRAVRQRRRRRELQLRRLRPGRHPSTRAATRPAGRRHHDAADGRGRRAAQPGHPDERPTRRASTARSCGDPDTGAALPDNPNAASATRTRAASSPTACATRSASRSAPGRTTSTSATWAGTLGGDRPRCRAPPRRSRTSAGRATRATGARRRTTAST